MVGRKRASEVRSRRGCRNSVSGAVLFLQQRQRVHRGPLPPVFLGPEEKYRQVQVGRGRRRVAGGPDVAQQLALAQVHPLFQPLRVTIQVRVVVTPGAGIVELIHGQTARLAVEQLDHVALGNRSDFGTARRHDIERLMCVVAAHLREIAA